MADERADEDLMAAYVAGDEQAFDELFRRYSPVLLGFFRRRRFQPADCHDLVQQTFLRLHRVRAQFRHGERVRPWLFTLARNLGCDELRRVNRRAERCGDVDGGWVSSFSAPPTTRGDDARVLARALARLSQPEQHLIDEHFAQERSFHELAVRHGVQAATLRVRAHRARSKLRALLTGRAA